jgi:hypothetical protein
MIPSLTPLTSTAISFHQALAMKNRGKYLLKDQELFSLISYEAKKISNHRSAGVGRGKRRKIVLNIQIRA